MHTGSTDERIDKEPGDDANVLVAELEETSGVSVGHWSRDVDMGHL
jgi:hypothetical protein